MTVLTRLVERLKGAPFDVAEVPPSQLLEDKGPTPARLSQNPTLVFQRVGFELTPDVVIHDGALGTLGLVRVLASKDQGNARSVLEQWIDDATYARHLILTDESSQRHAPCSIELVAVVPKTREVLNGLSEQLRVMARRTSYLHAISVNLLAYEDDQLDVSDDELKQAFAWLLPHTRARFGGYASPKPQPRLLSVQLHNYRLSGSRSLLLERSLSLHVVHGHNGTGKSTLVEALEFGVTGRVARIDAAHGADALKNYLPVIANAHHPESPVRVIFKFDSAKSDEALREVRLLDTGPQGALRGDLDARSSRLNQAFMDELTAGSDAERAEAFLGAFFPQARTAYLNLANARQAWTAAFAALPHAATEISDASARIATLGPSFEKELAAAHGGASTSLNYEALLAPVDAATANALELLNPGIARTSSELREKNWTDERMLSKLDDDLKRTQGELSEMLPKLAQAEHLAKLLAPWRVQTTANPRGSFATTLGQWLKLMALTDLAERRLQLGDARQAIGQLRPPHTEAAEEQTLWAAVPEHDLAALRRQVEIWRKLRDQCAADVKKLADGAADSSDGASSATLHPPRVAPEELTTLDQVGHWLFGEQGFGAAIGRALAENQVQHFAGKVEIGSGDWTHTWQLALKELNDAARKLTAIDLAADGGVARSQRLRAAAKAAHEKQVAEAKVEAEFAQHLSRLEDPLNELLAMLTPARWAYARTKLQSTEQLDGPSRLQLVTTDGARADLRFNTAELNTLTLALFLLCAPAVENPLRTLILDDPFQNMDELTISTVLRGLSRIALLLPPGWQIIILVHGEETLEVVRRELACATYKLPWLRPLQEPVDVPIERDSLYIRESALHPLRLVLAGGA